MNTPIEKILWSARDADVRQYHLRDRLLKAKHGNVKQFVRAGGQLNQDDFTLRGWKIAESFLKNDDGVASILMQPFVLTIAKAKAFSWTEVHNQVSAVLRTSSLGRVSIEQLREEGIQGGSRAATDEASVEAGPQVAEHAQAPEAVVVTGELPEPIILPANNPILQLRVYILQYKGAWYLHIREWYSKDGEFKPSQKGVAIRLELMDRFGEALAVMQAFIAAMAKT